MIGYFNNGSISQCLACHYSCLACNNKNTLCLNCTTNSLSHRTFNSGANTCPCDPGYWDNGTGICLSCHVTCKTCDGPGP